MKKYFLLIAVVGLCLTSCKKCKDCTVKVEILSTSTMDDAMCEAASTAAGGSATTCEGYFNDVYAAGAAEYCDDDLDAVDGLDLGTDGINYRAYYDCQ